MEGEDDEHQIKEEENALNNKDKNFHIWNQNYPVMYMFYIHICTLHV